MIKGVKINFNNLKFTKFHKNSIKLNFLNKNKLLKFNKFFLVCLSYSRLSIKQIEVARRAIVRYTQKFVFVKLNINPFFIFTKKSQKSRMGKGAGSINSLEFNLRPGIFIFELISTSSIISKNSFLKASNKLPGKYTIIKK